MELRELHCRNFRRLAELRFSPMPGLNVIRGQNAAGKTSILEALLYVATSKSHRTNTERELVRDGAEGFQVRARITRRTREVVLEAFYDRGAKRFRVNGVPQPRMSDMLGQVNLVFFCPEDLALVRGAATVRRRFLDMELSQLHAGYLYALQQYRLVLRHRNELLRADRPDPALIDVWDDQMAKHGTVLMEERARFVDELSREAAQVHRIIAPEEELEVRYQPDVPSGLTVAEIVAAAREADLRNRVTTRGPHRDDVYLTVSGRAARQFASQGQQRTAALALKLAEIEIVRARTGEPPILLLDDVLSELDARRARRLAEAVPQNAQSILTTTDLTTTESLYGAACANFVIQGGRLEKT